MHEGVLKLRVVSTATLCNVAVPLRASCGLLKAIEKTGEQLELERASLKMGLVLGGQCSAYADRSYADAGITCVIALWTVRSCVPLLLARWRWKRVFCPC